MKNELGIKICCENCKHCTDNGNGCGLIEMPNDGIFGTRHCAFSPSKEAYEIRIKELQEQQFTEEELNTLNGILQDYFRVYTTQHYRTKPLLNKIERILNNEQ